MIDVFAGAGGLSLGFKWKGWLSLAATDIERHFVETFNRNVSPVAFIGDMRADEVLERLVKAAPPPSDRTRPLALVGGPPCQGFSTGNRRSEQDERNGLHVRYAALLARLQPDVFVFENVLGLVSMSKGTFLPRILAGLRAVGYDVDVWKINAAEFGLPQRRQRVVIVGVPSGCVIPDRPPAWTSPLPNPSLPFTATVSEALSDLPAIAAGQDGTELPYRSMPQSAYQQFLRGQINAEGLLRLMRSAPRREAA
jgi:DNA (cytosine-5)-methyltransferase 1